MQIICTHSQMWANLAPAAAKGMMHWILNADPFASCHHDWPVITWHNNMKSGQWWYFPHFTATEDLLCQSSAEAHSMSGGTYLTNPTKIMALIDAILFPHFMSNTKDQLESHFWGTRRWVTQWASLLVLWHTRLRKRLKCLTMKVMEAKYEETRSSWLKMIEVMMMGTKNTCTKRTRKQKDIFDPRAEWPWQ